MKFTVCRTGSICPIFCPFLSKHQGSFIYPRRGTHFHAHFLSCVLFFNCGTYGVVAIACVRENFSLLCFVHEVIDALMIKFCNTKYHLSHRNTLHASDLQKLKEKKTTLKTLKPYVTLLTFRQMHNDTHLGNCDTLVIINAVSEAKH